MREIKGPDFPTGALIMGAKGIEDAYRTGRGSIIMRAVVEVEEIQGRQCLVVTELPYQVNPDSLAQKIAEHVKDGRLSGIADIRDETSGRTGQRLVIVLKRDAIAKVVLNNLFKHTQLQTTFGANMLALVDGVPRTLPIDAFIRYWVDHQVDVIQRRTAYRLRKAEERIHILRGLLKALDALDEVIALIRRSPTVDEARDGLMELLEIDEVQAQAILDMQLRRLAALERQKIIDDHDELAAQIEDFTDILAKPGRQRDIVSEELDEIVQRLRRRPPHDDPALRRRHVDGGPHPRGGRRRDDHPGRLRQAHPGRRLPQPEARRQGRARGGAAWRGHGRPLLHDDLAPLAALLHQPGPRLPRQGLRAAGCRPRLQGPARRQRHGVPARRGDRPGARGARLLQRLVPRARHEPGWSRRPGSPSTTAPAAAASSPINLRDGDELVGAGLAEAGDDLLLVSRKGQSVRFHADDATLRPMGRATSGVTGMKFRNGDSLLSMSVVQDGTDPDVFVVFEYGWPSAPRSRTGTSRAAGCSASPWPGSPTRAATSSGPSPSTRTTRCSSSSRRATSCGSRVGGAPHRSQHDGRPVRQGRQG